MTTTWRFASSRAPNAEVSLRLLTKASLVGGRASSLQATRSRAPPAGHIPHAPAPGPAGAARTPARRPAPRGRPTRAGGLPRPPARAESKARAARRAAGSGRRRGAARRPWRANVACHPAAPVARGGRGAQAAPRRREEGEGGKDKRASAHQYACEGCGQPCGRAGVPERTPAERGASEPTGRRGAASPRARTSAAVCRRAGDRH